MLETSVKLLVTFGLSGLVGLFGFTICVILQTLFDIWSR